MKKAETITFKHFSSHLKREFDLYINSQKKITHS